MPGKRLTHRVGYLLVIGIIAKFFIDTSVQIFNPYLVIYAAGLGVGTLTMGRLVSLRNLSGLIAPLIGSLADRYGYRRIMRFNLLVTGIGILLFAVADSLPALIIAMVIWGVGQGGFGPNLHSYVSSMLPYSKRSRYLGMVEYSWALAGIIGLFLFGWLIEVYSWRAPLFILSAGLILSSLIMSTLPKSRKFEKEAPTDGDPAADQAAGPGRMGLDTAAARPILQHGSADEKAGSLPDRIRRFFYLGRYQRSAWSCILISVCNYYAITHVMIIHGGWLEAEYGLNPSQLGTVALILGLVDWAGSILVSAAGDKIGKKRSVFIGILGMLVFFLVLPFANINVYMAIAGLLLPRFFFEFATVSNFPLISEQEPSQRGKILAFSVSGGLFGTTIAAVTGPAAYLKAGVWGLGPASAAAVVISLVMLLLFVTEEPHLRG